MVLFKGKTAVVYSNIPMDVPESHYDHVIPILHWCRDHGVKVLREFKEDALYGGRIALRRCTDFVSEEKVDLVLVDSVRVLGDDDCEVFSAVQDLRSAGAIVVEVRNGDARVCEKIVDCIRPGSFKSASDNMLFPKGMDVKSPVPIGDLDTGISTGKVCPEGYVQARINGGIGFDVRRVGSFGIIQDSDGIKIGCWSVPIPIRGSMVYGGEIRVSEQLIRWQYRESSKGERQFMLYPSYIFLDPKKFKTEDEAKEVFLDIANSIADLLADHGWELENPEFKGEIEYDIRDDQVIGQVREPVSEEDDVVEVEPEVERTEDTITFVFNVPKGVREFTIRIREVDE